MLVLIVFIPRFHKSKVKKHYLSYRNHWSSHEYAKSGDLRNYFPIVISRFYLRSYSSTIFLHTSLFLSYVRLLYGYFYEIL